MSACPFTPIEQGDPDCRRRPERHGERLVLILTIVGWDLFFDWLASRFPRARAVLQPPQLPLVLDGVIQWRNLRKEMVSEEELHMHLRQHGLEDISQVKLCCLESDGHISVIEKK